MLLSIFFAKTNSKNYRKTLAIAQCIPFTEMKEGTVFIPFLIEKDVALYSYSIKRILSLAAKWKSFVLEMDNKPIAVSTYQEWADSKAKEMGNPLAQLFSGEAIYEKNLPYPIAYYSKFGTFLSFSKEPGGKLVLCECEKEGVQKYLKRRLQGDQIAYASELRNCICDSYDFSETFSRQCIIDGVKNIDDIEFHKNICFRCCNVIPIGIYCHPMYGGVFMQKNGWYVKQRYEEYGITDETTIRNIDWDKIPKELLELVTQRVAWHEKYSYEVLAAMSDKARNEVRKRHDVLTAAIDHFIENEVRRELGYKVIGEQWTNETMMIHIIEKIYPDCEIKKHYRPEWLDKLELDAYVPDHKIGFEYQGIQHYKPVKQWGGENQLKKQQEHDKHKLELCRQLDIKLIIISYDEPLSEELILKKINDSTGTTT